MAQYRIHLYMKAVIRLAYHVQVVAQPKGWTKQAPDDPFCYSEIIIKTTCTKMPNSLWDQSLKKGLMVAGILGCLAVAYYFAIFLPRTNNDSTNKINQQNQTKFAVNPKEYIASILQIGGEGSTSVTKSTWETEEGSHLNPDEFAFVTTNTPVDVVWLSCKDGYTASDPISQTGNQILSGVNKSTFGITLGAQVKNQLNITCIK